METKPSNTSANDFTDISKADNALERARASPKLWEIADVCFGKADMDEIPVYQQLSVYRANYIKLNLEMNNSNTKEEKKAALKLQI